MNFHNLDGPGTHSVKLFQLWICNYIQILSTNWEAFCNLWIFGPKL